MNVLSDEVKTFIVQQLACFDPPSVVVKAVKAEFNETVSPQQVESYNPERRAGQNLGEHLRELFRVTREAFLEDTASIGISHRVTRLRTLQRLADRAETQGNIALAAQLVVQAAKEVGDVFTNRQRIDANHTVRSHEDALGDLE
ncbi:hypothetical protein ABID82_002383 [Methylobacterium sp. PvP062]|uniref:DUF2280 domain-containing protein n=1 Tax=Methylobacterium radiotolerans TaxID=31998 RepID=A0ABV2NNG2_9HYPH|nr:MULTISPECIES: DUF2280 domain-containing protein [unclassified Methylobacterium]MBP2495285.1 hypothetical protein [Methylobacterium sp. PvP105]MBP2504844.1 hypothetical protein [Methylobacterium sp. PvP109]MCX7335851.1 DUF2280 domain-containing protein [Hyphomicrobiales bacterium]